MGYTNHNTKNNRHGGTADRESRVAIIFIVVTFTIIAVFMALTSCNVTRTVTTSAQTIQRGDTTTIIQTRTIEQYDGSLTDPRLR